LNNCGSPSVEHILSMYVLYELIGRNLKNEIKLNVWQAGRLEINRNKIIGPFSAIIKKNKKSFGRLQGSA